MHSNRVDVCLLGIYVYLYISIFSRWNFKAAFWRTAFFGNTSFPFFCLLVRRLNWTQTETQTVFIRGRLGRKLLWIFYDRAPVSASPPNLTSYVFGEILSSMVSLINFLTASWSEWKTLSAPNVATECTIFFSKRYENKRRESFVTFGATPLLFIFAEKVTFTDLSAPSQLMTCNEEDCSSREKKHSQGATFVSVRFTLDSPLVHFSNIYHYQSAILHRIVWRYPQFFFFLFFFCSLLSTIDCFVFFLLR